MDKAPMNLVKVAAAWNSTSWLWGVKPGFHQRGSSPNPAAAFKLIVLGEVDTRLANMPSLLQAACVANMECKGLKAIVALLEQLSSERFHVLVRNGLDVVHKKMTKEALHYTPCGWLVLEKASVDSSVVYGARASYFWDTMAAKQADAHAKELPGPNPLLFAKRQIVFDLFSAGTWLQHGLLS